MSRLLAKNEHLVDRALRVLLGLGLLSLMFVGPHTALGYIGLVPLATGLLGSCRCTRFSVSRPAACRPTRAADRLSRRRRSWASARRRLHLVR
jgi:hypothetical protein